METLKRQNNNQTAGTMLFAFIYIATYMYTAFYKMYKQ